MAKANRFCYTDNKPYYYCPSCPSEKRVEAFYNMFCCERCAKIFHLLTDETFKRITTEQCKKELLKLGVTTKEMFKDNIKAHIKRVLSYKAPTELETINIVEEDMEVKKIDYVPKKKKSKNSEVD